MVAVGWAFWAFWMGTTGVIGFCKTSDPAPLSEQLFMACKECIDRQLATLEKQEPSVLLSQSSQHAGSSKLRSLHRSGRRPFTLCLPSQITLPTPVFNCGPQDETS
ncbi:hypothetical protein MBM_08024 [Drepanopeziza brunnea f. sp. 'multigermtubi' MB_m1]|uniref:Uncharacterized protein n=1 Tax=Marssonina brunnea f. sp. multigermtubi (strain MB_m1) TaxID=1072389 RepID=K1WYW2_MARBU|nr:uncharacterized protein MBM_08024 [Drepanopeziza brunnea f. sp. 'multigermtubi' MB_m1]EKD13823.1 hypothetical protein MBM_08024 [Drepanopeziza brunnea f. sp. 'multigermtubi' MB_m1]